MNAVRAGALAVKGYGWYKILNPSLPGLYYGADVVDNENDQVYILNSYLDHPKATQATDFERYVAVANSNNQIFKCSYKSGVVGQAGPQYSGQLLQNGAQYLAKTYGYNEINILSYYYSYSSASPDVIVLFSTY